MTAVHTGIIPQSCGKCQRDPTLKEFWGCDKPSQTVVERLMDDNGEIQEYYSCPNKFVSQSVHDWFNEYSMTKSGQAQPVPYRKQSSNYVYSLAYYEKWMNIYNSKIMESKRLG
jgi:hypothetical protein